MAGAMSEAFVWVRIATAKSVLQCGSDEIKYQPLSRQAFGWRAGHNPDDKIPLVDGGCLVHKLRALMHGTCSYASAAVRAIVAAKLRACEAHFGVEARAALPELIRETFDGGCHNRTMQLPFVKLSGFIMKEK